MFLDYPVQQRDHATPRAERVEEPHLFAAEFVQSLAECLGMRLPELVAAFFRQLDQREGVGQVPLLQRLEECPDRALSGGRPILLDSPTAGLGHYGIITGE